MAYLSGETIRKISDALESGMRAYEVANEFGVSPPTVYSIRKVGPSNIERFVSERESRISESRKLSQSERVDPFGKKRLTIDRNEKMIVHSSESLVVYGRIEKNERVRFDFVVSVSGKMRTFDVVFELEPKLDSLTDVTLKNWNEWYSFVSPMEGLRLDAWSNAETTHTSVMNKWLSMLS